MNALITAIQPKRTKAPSLCHADEGRENFEGAAPDHNSALCMLGQSALLGVELDALFDQAMLSITELLGVDCADVLKVMGAKGDLELLASYGWDDPLCGCAGPSVSLKAMALAGYTLDCGEPIVIDDFAAGRFSAGHEAPQRPPSGNGICSSISVVIEGREGPFGVLQAHSRAPRRFEPEQVQFLQNVANVLSIAIMRETAERAMRDRERYFRALLEQVADLIVVLSPDGFVNYASPAVERFLGYAPHEVAGRAVHDLVHAEDAGRLRQLLGCRGQQTSLELRLRHKSGAWRHLSIASHDCTDDASVGGIVLNAREAVA
jgi:PAS domain S-box-containing protein